MNRKIIKVSIQFFIIIFLLLFPVISFSIDTETEIKEVFEDIITLWNDEKYEKLWEYGTNVDKSVYSTEYFKNRMKNSGRKLEIGWQKVQDVSIKVEFPTLAYVKAKIGFKLISGTIFETKQIQFIKEKEGWRTHLSNFLN